MSLLYPRALPHNHLQRHPRIAVCRCPLSCYPTSMPDPPIYLCFECNFTQVMDAPCMWCGESCEQLPRDDDPQAPSPDP